MSEATPNPGEQWKLKDSMAPDDVRLLYSGAPLRDVDFADLRGEVVLVAGPSEDGRYPALALSLGGAEVVIRRKAFDERTYPTDQPSAKQ